MCYDSRNHSKDFAEITARVLACEGIKVYLSDRLRPVPMLSFGIRHYRTAGGVMITASHNPREYNGFKVYGNDGGQLSPAGANAVQERMPEFEDVVDYLAEMLPLEEALFCEVNPIPVKYAMNVLGWNAGECRLPLVEPCDAHKAKIEQALQAAGLIKE